MSAKSEETVYGAREKVCSLFGFDNPSGVVFTHNATYGLNFIINGIVNKSSHVIVTSMEHNSVMRPVVSSGCMYDVVYADKDGYVNGEDVEKCIKGNTALIICTLSSNVCGSVQPFEKIAEISNKHGIPFLLDASQGAGSIAINMDKCKIDYLAAPGHKGLLGPMGTGIVCIKGNSLFNSIIKGGTGSYSKLMVQPDILPDKFESGTLNVVGIAGLSKSLDYILNAGTESILYHENKLCNSLAEKLGNISKVRLAGYVKDKARCAVLSFVIDGIDTVNTASMLNLEYNIAVRAGFHCAYNAHCSLNTENTGTVRVSFGPFNTIEQVDAVANAVKEIALQNNRNTL